MKLRIFAEDKPAEKLFEYQLELADQTILLSTALLSGAIALAGLFSACLLYTSPSPRDTERSRMPSSA